MFNISSPSYLSVDFGSGNYIFLHFLFELLYLFLAWISHLLLQLVDWVS